MNRQSTSAVLLAALGLCWPLGAGAAAQEEMIYVPGGKFIMGTSAEQRQRLAQRAGLNPDLFAIQNDKVVDVSDFWIDKFEITNRQYREFVQATNHKPPPSWSDRGYPAGKDDYPFDSADLSDAQAYARWAGKRLPTEAEWEKAARGTDGRLWVWGNEWQEGACKKDDSRGAPLSAAPAPVGSYPLDCSVYGVMDMAGNVLELVTAELTGKAQGLQLKKGGSFMNEAPFSFLCATRHADPGGSQMGYTGFRCARNATPDETRRLGRSLAVPEPSHAAARPPRVQLQASVEPFRPIPERYRRGKVQIFPVYQLDPEQRLYAFLPQSKQEKDALARITPWCVEIRAPYLPGDRFRAFFEGYYQHPLRETRFNDDFTSALLKATLPNSHDITIRLEGGPDYVDIIYESKTKGIDLGVQMCLMCLFAPNFADLDGLRTFFSTDERLRREVEVRHHVHERFWQQWFDVGPSYVGLPGVGPRVQGNHVMTVSRNQQWLVAPVSMSGPSRFLFHNREYSCIHCDPAGPSVAPDATPRVKQRIYLLQGTPQDLVRRHESDLKAEAAAGGQNH